ncbi:hypothetical protein EYC84_009361 [Monilinia fructicola]|uniref:Uncharacterized protein n=1 Tax=Monilinia fructicola TaxID=38448 RepID=A0A5M9JC94_MONFR|nr:hypothetical protein EYC84_009361 [Monilinia fructicola]
MQPSGPKPTKPFKASRRRRREERERRDSEDQGQNPDQSRGHLRDRGEYGQGEGQRRQEDPYNDPEIEEAGYDSEPDYTSRQKERNMRDRDWGWDSRERDGDLRDIPRHSGAGTEAGYGYGYGYGYPYEESHGSHSRPNSPTASSHRASVRNISRKHRAAPEPPPRQPTSASLLCGPHGALPRRAHRRGKGKGRHPPTTIHATTQFLRRHPRGAQLATGSTERRLAPREPRRGARSDHGSSAGGGMRDRADRYGLKDEVRGLFTDSPRGLAGGALGALVGGWATEKLQEAQTGRDRRAMGDRAKVYTLLGAAAGGWSRTRCVDKWQGGGRRRGRGGAEEKYPDGTEDARVREGGEEEGSRARARSQPGPKYVL